MFNFSLKNFLKKMVASGYPVDDIECITFANGDFWEVDILHRTHPEKVCMEYDTENDTYMVMHSQYQRDDDSIVSIEWSKSYMYEDNTWIDTNGLEVNPDKIVLDVFDALHNWHNP